MADRVRNRPIKQFKPLTIDYDMYAHQLFSCNAQFLHNSFWRPQMFIWRLCFINYLLAPFPKTSVSKKGHQGPLWTSSDQVIKKSTISYRVQLLPNCFSDIAVTF